MPKMHLSGNAELLEKFSSDYLTLVSAGATKIPNNRIYLVSDDPEAPSIPRNARKVALAQLCPNIVKQAMDSRKTKQSSERNPRQALQYYHRNDPFVSTNTQEKLNIFAKLMVVMEDIKREFGEENIWHESYARELYDNLGKALRVKTAGEDFHEPYLAYLEQLLYARYRLSMEEINKQDSGYLKQAILNKDEALLKRGVFLNKAIEKQSTGPIVIDGRNNIQQNIVEAIFGNNNFRREGEKTVERTITITIKDEVKD